MLQVAGGGLLAVVVTLLAAALFYAVTLHLAATFFVGEVPTQPAAAVGAGLAVVALALQRWGPLVTVAVSLVGDLLGVYFAYELDWGPTVALTLLHLAFATVLGLALNNIFGFV